MENIIAPWNLPNIKEGRFAQPLPPNRDLQVVTAWEIGKKVRQIVDSPHSYDKKRIELASESITPERMVEILTSHTGLSIEYIHSSSDSIPNEDTQKMFKWLETTGYDAEILEGGTSFDTWAGAQDWDTPLA